MKRTPIALLAWLVAGSLSLPALAAAAITGAELTALLGNGKSIELGGPGSGYVGTLMPAANGAGKREVKTDDRTILTLTGKWRIKGGQFCRTWLEFDGSKEVCETWEKDGDNQVRGLVDGKPIRNQSLVG